MRNIFITELDIEKVRHLKNITISLSQDKMKHLIFTGKNGSGKTSVLQILCGKPTPLGVGWIALFI